MCLTVVELNFFLCSSSFLSPLDFQKIRPSSQITLLLSLATNFDSMCIPVIFYFLSVVLKTHFNLVRTLRDIDTWKPIWPSGPARGCYSWGRRFESVCRPSSVVICGSYGQRSGLPPVYRFDPGTHLTDEAKRTLDLPTRRSCHGTSPWLST